MNIELNFIHNQIEANNKIISMLHFEMTTLSNLISQKRKWIDEITEQNKQLQHRISSMNNIDKSIVKHYNTNK